MPDRVAAERHILHCGDVEFFLEKTRSDQWREYSLHQFANVQQQILSCPFEWSDYLMLPRILLPFVTKTNHDIATKRFIAASTRLLSLPTP